MNQMFYIGVVENRKDDPLQLGRVQVRVFGVHSESLEEVPVSALPWAIPLMPATSASLSGIGHSVTQYVEGTMVFVFFSDGEAKQQPVIMGSFHGVPSSKEYFTSKSESEELSIKTGTEPVSETIITGTPTGVVDSSGTPVVDSSGQPIQTDVPVTGVDISKAVSKYGSNVSLVHQALLDFGIRDDNAIIGILSNVAKETGFKSVRENMTYSSIDRIRAIFPSKTRNKKDDELQAYVNNPEKLSNLVYANSDGNGDESSGDGYKYRGGGFIQLTKKNNYSQIGKQINVDLTTNPDLILDPKVSAKVVAQYMVNRFGGANRLTFGTVDEALSAITNKVNPGGLANDLPKVKSASALFSSSATPEQIEAKKQAAEAQSPNDPSNDLNKTATQEEIDSGLNSKKTSRIGFKDPNDKFPLSSTLKEADTNRLARRRTTGTMIDTKLKNRRSSIKCGTDTFGEPLPAYNASYPYNHVLATEAGHIMEFDDTPNSERVQTFHKSGTFTEIDKFGNSVNKIMGDQFTIVERNGYIYIDGTARVSVGSDVKLYVAGNLDITVDGSVNYDIGGNLTLKVGGSINGKGGTGVSLRSDSGIDFDGSMINLNSNTAKQVDVSARSGTSNDYPLQVPQSFMGDASLAIEEASDSEVDAHLEKEIASGNVTRKEVEDGNAAMKAPEKTDEAPPPPQAKLDASCTIFEGKTDIPDSTQLTQNFTLGMLSSKAAASSYKVKAQHGLSVPEIACNLKKVALNCLEKIKAQYPRMIVTSGFRHGSGTSQHERGQAIDMQFGVSNSDYFDIAVWIKNNVLFDQLLLEYKTIESGKAWIHISFTDSPRKAVYTYMNHKNAGTGLRKLQ